MGMGVHLRTLRQAGRVAVMTQAKIVLNIKDPKDVLTVADALLKSGYTVSTPKKKVGGKLEHFVVATMAKAAPGEGETE